MEEFNQFIEKFKVNELMIKKTKFWSISLRPFQPTLGCLVLSLNRPCKSFSDITENEGADLSSATKIIENTLTSAFSFDKINYLMLMMIDEHVHFHVIPRYSNTKEFNGENWVDNNWPKPPEIMGLKIDSNTSDEMMKTLKNLL